MDANRPDHVVPAEGGGLVAFELGAAGHQGISATADGDVIVKPCTQAEIDFYEAARDHPDFQALMPVYMGKLEEGNKTTAVAPEAQHAIASMVDQGVAMPSTTSTGAGSAEMPQTIETTLAAAPVEDNQPTSAQSQETIKPIDTKEWVPSGGAKLDTGLAIVLENAAAGFKHPNVLDLKLGSRLWDDNAPESKRQKLDGVSAATTSSSLGFRVAGMKIWMGTSHSEELELHTSIRNGYKSYDKNYGRGLNQKTVEMALARFLSGSAGTQTMARDKSVMKSKEAAVLAEYLLRELESIEETLVAEESRMYSASILIVIEGDPRALREAMEEEKKFLESMESKEAQKPKGGKMKEEDDDDDDDDDELDFDEPEKSVPKVMEVRLIDFAHAKFTPGLGPDENALRGVRSVIKIVKNIGK